MKIRKDRTDQENFWAGSFGDKYIARNSDKNIVADNIVFFSRILSNIGDIKSVIEFGSSIGLNLVAIKAIFPSIKISAVEINKIATDKLKKLGYVKVYNKSLFDFKVSKTFDLCLVKGVLIHQNPDFLNNAYDMLFKYSKKYILIAEYYNPTPVEVKYRGYYHKLFKRDFAGEMLEKYKGKIKLTDYGFTYRNDPHPQSDLTWFLLEKVGA